MLFSIEVLIELSCRAFRALEDRNQYRMCAVEFPELWRPELDAFLNRNLHRTELSILESSGIPKSIHNVLWSSQSSGGLRSMLFFLENS